MEIREKIWALIKSKEPTNIALAIELAEGQEFDLKQTELINLYNELYPLTTNNPKKEKLIRLFSTESLNLTKKIPQKIDLLPNLEELTLDGMTFYQFEFANLRKAKALEHLKLVNLKQNGLGKDLHSIPQLKSLSINFSAIGYLHPNIGQMKNLQKIELQYVMDLKKLPEEILQLKNLKVLKILQPKLDLDFLELICQMTQLRIIILDNDLLKKTEREQLQKALPNCRISYI